MKDFAKSIRSGNSKVGNSVTEKEFNSEADLRRWCIDHNYTYTPIGGGYYRLEDDKPGSHKPDIEAHVKSGNSKVGNANYSGASDQDLKNWIRMMEQDIKNYERESKKYEWYGKNEKGTYGATQYGHAIGEIKEAQENIKRMKEELERRKRAGNSKVGNAIKKFGMGSLVIADGHKAVVFKETVEQGPNGIPFGWVTVRFVEGPWKGQTDEYYDYDLKKA